MNKEDIRKKLLELDVMESKLHDQFVAGEISKECFNFEMEGICMTRELLERR